MGHKIISTHAAESVVTIIAHAFFMEITKKCDNYYLKADKRAAIKSRPTEECCTTETSRRCRGFKVCVFGGAATLNIFSKTRGTHTQKPSVRDVSSANRRLLSCTTSYPNPSYFLLLLKIPS